LKKQDQEPDFMDKPEGMDPVEAVVWLEAEVVV
jgi:hypothetical protein